jgi:hypothetical protein
MAKRDELSHNEIQSQILGKPSPSSGPRRDRTRQVASGNPDVLNEAFGSSPGEVGRPNPRVQDGPAWRSGMKAWGGVEHHPGKMDTPDIGRRKVVTY